MTPHWEWIIWGSVAASAGVGLLTWVIVYEVREWRSTLAWLDSVMRSNVTPIYGPADPYRTKGPDAMPNRRRG
jgi:hypothetical protein